MIEKTGNSTRVIDRFRNWLIEKKIGLISFIVFIVAWELLVQILKLPAYLLPAPTAIIRELTGNWQLIGWYTLVTAYETFLGFFISIAIGVPLSTLIAFNAILRKTLYPMAVAIQLLPKIALAPLFITWFGFGYLPKIIIVFLLCFFPVLLNGILGFLSISQELEWFAYSTGAGKFTTFWKVRFPFALPQIFVGIRWAAVNATVGATIGEWIGGDAGLGYYIQIATGDLRMNLAFAIIVVLAALGMFLFYVTTFLERKLIPWHTSQRRVQKGGGFV